MTARYAIFTFLCFIFLSTLVNAQNCTDVQACNFGNIQPCVYPGESCDDLNTLTFNDVYASDCTCIGQNEVRLEMFDMGDNGYSGTSITITNSSDGTAYGPFTLTSGGSSEVLLNLPIGCYEISSTDDAQDDEVYYVLNSLGLGMEETLMGIPGDTQTFGVGVISGCTDPLAVNYDTQATCDSGGCYICDIDGDCEIGTGGFLKPLDCNIITICGPGLYYIVGLESGGIFTEACKDIPLPTKLGDYEIRFLPIGGTMELVYEDTKAATEPTCYYVDENGCNGHLFDWKKPKKGILQMEDDCDLGWAGVHYKICDSQFNIIETGSLNNAEFGNTIALGFDSFNLDDGCYILKFFADDCFYPCQEFILLNTDEPEVTGLIDGTSFPFTVNSTPCTYGCIDPLAINFDNMASNPCLGDNSCCEYIPINNNCDMAMVLTPGNEIEWNTSLSTASAFNCFGNPTPDLWYTYTTSDCDMNFEIQAFSESNPSIQVYREICPSGFGEEIYCPVSPLTKLSAAAIEGDPAITYYIQINTDLSISDRGIGTLKLIENGCRGCTNSDAANFDPLAEIEDGSCICNDCPGDFNGDGDVNVSDLGGFLGTFGTSCIPPVD